MFKDIAWKFCGMEALKLWDSWNRKPLKQKWISSLTVESVCCEKSLETQNNWTNIWNQSQDHSA